MASPGVFEPRQARLDAIYTGWRKVRERRPRALSWFESPREMVDAVSVLVALATALGFVALDAVFQAPGEAASQEAEGATSVAVWLLLPALVYAVQAILVHRLAAERFPDPNLLPRRWRWACRGLAGVPLFGLYVLPGWLWLANRYQEQRETARFFTVPLAVPRKPARLLGDFDLVTRAARRVPSAAGFATLFLAGFVSLYSLCLLIPTLCPPSGFGRWAVLTAVLVLHLASACAVAIHLWLQAGKLRLSQPVRWGWSVLASLWLVPVPGAAFLALLVYVVTLLAMPDPRDRSLTGGAFRGVSEVGALPVWQRLLAGVESSWRGRRGWTVLRRPTGLRTPRGEGEVESRLLLLCRGKAALLFLEAAALSWVLEASAAANLLDRRGVEATLGTLGVLSLLGGAVGLAGMGISFARRILRPGAETVRSSPLLAAAPYLAGTQLSACAGLVFGTAVAARDPGQIGGVLALTGLVGAVLHVGPTFLGLVLPVAPASGEAQRVSFFSILAYLGVGFIGLGILRGQPGPWSGPALGQLLWLGPAVSLMLGAAGQVWLRRALGGGDRDTHAGLRSRIEHPSLVVPALLPLGGFVVPLWVLAWQRRRR